MAVFMLNICTFDDCRITFPTLKDLIYHIEFRHIDHDPAVNQRREAAQPASVPFSYVLRFTTEEAIRKYQDSIASAEVPCQVASREPSSLSSSALNTPTGSECEEEDVMSPPEDSNDSWTTVDEYSQDYILRHFSRGSVNRLVAAGGTGVDKPFACPVPGCKKRYKNVNGIKYHSKNGHKDGKVRKGYKCHCGKNYKTAQGLKTHSISQHFANNESPLVTGAAHSIQGLVVASYASRAGHDPALRIYDATANFARVKQLHLVKPDVMVRDVNRSTFIKGDNASAARKRDERPPPAPTTATTTTPLARHQFFPAPQQLSQ